jgi:hypothetical protein
MDTLSTVKALLGISDTSKDTVLNTLISIVEAEVKAYCNIEEIPALLTIILPQMVVQKYNRIGAEGIQSQSLGGVAESFTDSYTPSTISALNRYRRVRII